MTFPSSGALPPGLPSRPAVPAGIEIAGLSRWLRRRFPGEPGPLTTVRLLAGGRSNLTYLLGWGERLLVLRRPPLGHVLATAHDMAREFRALTALGPTDVPVPRTYGLCADPSVLGAPFYVMEWVEGRVLRTDGDLLTFTPKDAVRLTDAVAGTLAALHAVGPAAAGLAGFGRPEGFLERQVRRWRRQMEASGGAPPGADALNDRLAATCPASGAASIVHGDYKLDNLLLDPGDGGRIRAVLDWEMCTIGDPLADLGMLCMYWDGFAGVPRSPVASPGALPGWPGRDHLIERYTALSAVRPARLGWYTALAFYKIVAILRGIDHRRRQGLVVGDGFDGIADAVPMLVERGHAALDELE
ncbi:acyl-CoA dehydrogenase [Sphaerisporangium melleum]|uniref:Acyl-CoA dehydrogenase n=1 Tax=Sphaerisporangium melleum TaxID=321316 RepID=A0A917VIS7_9ACTN|nr:phosphotransferase family protein [Sphaerisporangium melleum]GGK87816.1 acyl-CoA dehydrogenase [Sphaerisporangium melleum]GII72447.1 acyl-CoA dehydrogenase [Sphaerisporangium melleum]